MREINLEDARADFAAHAALYLLVVTALIVLNLSFLTGLWWSVIPVVGWGVALALHYLYLRRVERADADWRSRNGPASATDHRARSGWNPGGGGAGRRRLVAGPAR